MSRSVTVCRQNRPFVLQIETNQNRPAENLNPVTSRRQNRFLLLQIEMFEAVSLQAELGRLVAALEVGGAHS